MSRFNTTCNASSFSGVIMLTQWQLYILVAINLLALIANLASNGTVIYLLLKMKMLRNMSLRLIFLLSCSDLFGALSVQILSAILMLKYARASFCKFQTAVQFFSVFTGHTSAYLIALIGIDRYMRMKYLNNYSQVVTQRREVVAIVFAVLLCLSHATLYAVGIELDFISKAKNITLAVDVVVAIVVITSYVRTIYVVKGYQKRAGQQDLLKDVNKALSAVASKILLALCITYVTYLLIKATFLITYNKVSYEGQQWLVFLVLASYAIIYCNATANALIFISSNRQIKGTLKEKGAKFIMHSKSHGRERGESSTATTVLRTDFHHG